jgi:hypothetical protein
VQRDDRGRGFKANDLFVKLFCIITAGEQFDAGLSSQGFADIFEVFESGTEDYY